MPWVAHQNCFYVWPKGSGHKIYASGSTSILPRLPSSIARCFDYVCIVYFIGAVYISRNGELLCGQGASGRGCPLYVRAVIILYLLLEPWVIVLLLLQLVLL